MTLFHLPDVPALAAVFPGPSFPHWEVAAQYIRKMIRKQENVKPDFCYFMNLTASVSERIQMSFPLQIEDSPPKIWWAGPRLAAGSFNPLLIYATEL